MDHLMNGDENGTDHGDEERQESDKARTARLRA